MDRDLSLIAMTACSNAEKTSRATGDALAQTSSQAMTQLLPNLLTGFKKWRARRSLNQLSRDFALILARARKELPDERLSGVAERLEHHLDAANQRIYERKDIPQLVLYDLTQSNRAARLRNDQIEFTAMTLAVIAFRAKCVEIASTHSDETQASRYGPLEREVTAFMSSPTGQDDQIGA